MGQRYRFIFNVWHQTEKNQAEHHISYSREYISYKRAEKSWRPGEIVIPLHRQSREIGREKTKVLIKKKFEIMKKYAFMAVMMLVASTMVSCWDKANTQNEVSETLPPDTTIVDTTQVTDGEEAPIGDSTVVENGEDATPSEEAQAEGAQEGQAEAEADAE